MRITIPQPQLLKHLQMVEHAVNERSTIPILGNVLIETKENELILTATDLDIGIQCQFPLSSPIEKGSVTLPARKLTAIVRELSDETVTIEAKKNHTATLTCGQSSFRMPGLPAEDFPSLPQTQRQQALAIPQGALKSLVDHTAYAMSMEETRFILNGALLAIKKDNLIMVATDGRRLALASCPLNTSPTIDLDVVIPAKTVRELGRLLQDGETDDVFISPLKENQLIFQVDALRVVTRLIEGQFPPYEKVIPPSTKQVCSIDRLRFLNAIRRVSLMTTATSQAVVFELKADRLVISKESAELGSAREELEVSYSGEPMTVAFNPQFWIDALKGLETDDVAIELSAADRPAVIRQTHFTYLVLPMKLS